MNRQHSNWSWRPSRPRPPPEPEESPEKYLNAWPASNLGAYSVVLGQGPGVGTPGLEDPSEPLAGLSISAFQPRGHP